MIGLRLVRRVLFAVLSRTIGTATYLIFFARLAPYRSLVRGLIKLLVIVRRNSNEFDEPLNDFYGMFLDRHFFTGALMDASRPVISIILFNRERFTFTRVVQVFFYFLRRTSHVNGAPLASNGLDRFRATRWVLANSFSFASLPQVRLAKVGRVMYFLMFARLIVRHGSFGARIIALFCRIDVYFRRIRTLTIQVTGFLMGLIRLRRGAYVNDVRVMDFFRYDRYLLQVVLFIMVDR